jgi:hypothetical protein
MTTPRHPPGTLTYDAAHFPRWATCGHGETRATDHYDAPYGSVRLLEAHHRRYGCRCLGILEKFARRRLRAVVRAETRGQARKRGAA